MRVLFAVTLVVCGGELDEHGVQHREHHPLKNSNEDFEEVEGKLEDHNGEEVDEPLHSQNRSEVAHGVEQILSGEDVPVKSQGERHRAHTDRDQLNDTDEQENGNQRTAHPAGKAALGTKHVNDEAPESDLLDRD